VVRVRCDRPTLTRTGHPPEPAGQLSRPSPANLPRDPGGGTAGSRWCSAGFAAALQGPWRRQRPGDITQRRASPANPGVSSASRGHTLSLTGRLREDVTDFRILKHTVFGVSASHLSAAEPAYANVTAPTPARP